MKWTDATQYSRGKERIQTAWQIKGKKIRVYLTKDHIYYPNSWIMHCYELGLKEVEVGKLDSLEIDEAKEKAVAIVEGTALKIWKDAKEVATATFNDYS